MTKKTKIIIAASVAAVLVVGLLLLLLIPASPKTKTAEFYYSINENCFWYEATIKEPDEVYGYSQAVKDGVVVTIEDHEDGSGDSYQIFDGTRVHSLNPSKLVYDTEITKKGIKLLFSKYDFEEFNDPKSAGDEVINGVTYYCETFNAVDENGELIGENKYYFENGRLKAIFWMEDYEIVRSMVFADYGETFPDYVYFAPPSDYTAGTLTQSEEIPFSQVFGDYEDNFD